MLSSSLTLKATCLGPTMDPQLTTSCCTTTGTMLARPMGSRTWLFGKTLNYPILKLYNPLTRTNRNSSAMLLSSHLLWRYCSPTVENNDSILIPRRPGSTALLFHTNWDTNDVLHGDGSNNARS